MGKKGREIVKANLNQLLSDLKAAYADEWIAFFYYTWAADYVEGLNYPNVASKLDDIAKEEFEHLSELADRIFELGGEPERDIEDLQKIANCKKVVFPKDERDLEGVLKAVIDAEGCAIDVYNNLIKKFSPCYDKDVRTFHLLEHILSEEIQHEEAFENLLPRKPKTKIKR
ncbi:MAG: ferritin-like domain-containing protein [Candidatus Bathyarchaeia archaeon]